MAGLKCKWLSDSFTEICTKSECDYRGGFCPVTEHPQACKYAEFEEMEVRLIDANALKRELDETKDVVISNKEWGILHGLNYAFDKVRSAPTIDAIPIEWLNERHRRTCEEGDTDLMDAICVLINEYHIWQGKQEVR